MGIPRFGASFGAGNAKAVLELILKAESLGVKGVWFTAGAGGGDTLTLCAAAALGTTSINIGTAIVPTFPRHPVVMAQQAATVAQLSPGRFNLGIGPSHAPTMESLGIPYKQPIGHLREYLTIVQSLLKTGTVDFKGRHFTVRARLAATVDAPVIISALREISFELAGELADGAVSWVCPAPYLRSVALPAMERGAQRLGRPRPPLIAHAFVCLTTDQVAFQEAATASVGNYPRIANYAGMFIKAGFPEAESGTFSEGIRDAVVLAGSAEEVREKVYRFQETAGAEAMVLSIIPIGPNRTAGIEATLEVVASL